MNRQQFLTELSQYLTFFSPQERAAVIAEFGEKFDSVGAEGESALIMELGTPMKVAIDLKRRKESGEKVTFSSVNIEVTSDGFMERYSVETETYESIISHDSIENVLENAAEEDPAPAVLLPRKRATPVKHAFALIGSTLLSILIAALFLTIAAAGVTLIVSMCYLLLAGLQSLHYLNDALLLFGGGLVLGGAGLLILWFGLWSAISLIAALFRGAKKLGPTSYKKECAA